MRLPTPVGSHPSQPAKPKLGTIGRRVVMSDFFPICNKWWSSTYRRMSFKLSVLPFCVWVPFFFPEKHNHRQKGGKRIYAKRIMRPALFFSFSLSRCYLMCPVLLVRIKSFSFRFFFSKQKAALDCGWDLMISNTSVSFTVRSTSIWCAFGERKKKGEKQNQKADSTAPVHFLVTIYILYNHNLLW